MHNIYFLVPILPGLIVAEFLGLSMAGFGYVFAGQLPRLRHSDILRTLDQILKNSSSACRRRALNALHSF
jgi:hypothetical protein